MSRRGENPRKPDRLGTFFCQLRFQLVGSCGNGERKPRRGCSVPLGRTPGPWAPATEVTQAPRASRRRIGEPGGGRRPALWLRAPPPGAAGNQVTWGAGLCRPLGRSAVPELIRRLFWPREAFRSPGVGRVGAACGHGNNQSHSCASTKPDAQREVNSGLLEGGFKRRHLQARPVVN